MDSVVHAWMDINWENVQLRIEEEVRAIGYRQDADEVARKVLLDESNLYRANTDKESRKVAVPLIKAFQKEVDRLTSKGRASEAALIDICSQLTDIPDPTGILVQSPIWKVQAEKTNNAIEEADQLRKSLSQLHSEFSDLTNQDVTIRQLRDSLKQLESDHEKELEKVIVETERSIKEDLAAREFETNMRSDKLKQDNVMLEKKVSELEAQIRDAERRMDTARVAATQRESLESEQMDILTRDLEASKRRVVSLESDVSRLSAELSEAQSSAKRGGLEDIAALGGLMKEKDEQIARLLAENRRLSEAIEVDAKKAQSRLDELQRDLKKQKSSGRDLELKLHDQADYEAIKKELRLLREIEFGEAAEANQESIERLGETVQSLDRLLAEKNRRLQNDNAQLRVANERYQESLSERDQALTDLRVKDVQQQKLIGKLEHDLQTMGNTGGKNSVIDMEDLSTLEMLESVAQCSGKEDVNGSSVVGILTSQRDRFKSRISTLEEELLLEKSRQNVVQAELEKVKEDNVKLYGKIKYLQSYGSKQDVTVPLDTRDNYGEQYERRLNPFARFNQSENQRSFTKLKLHDRASLSIGRAIMSSGSARIMFFCYLIFLHLMVFLVLYRFAFTESCDRDFQQDCVENFERHMKENHPGQVAHEHH